ncbi:hypothetical protein YC2023_049007 [Brassica napus]
MQLVSFDMLDPKMRSHTSATNIHFKHFILCIVWKQLLMMRLLKVYLLISMGKCISWLEREKSRGHTATPFIAQMVGKTCTFQVRASSYNFAANHQTFTISRILNERDRLPLSEFDGKDDHGDDMPGNISVLTKVDTDGDDREEAPTIGITSTGVHTNTPPATAISKVAKKARVA